jgi:flavin reductase (DIM6/NTAB) family NADH-FMN oxidoreductase RutF
MSTAKHDMRTVMGHFATGVCVISTQRPDGSAVGTTANAVSSVSLEPPLLLVCLAHNSDTLAAIRTRSHFVVNVLAEHQRDHSTRFAAKGDGAKSHEVAFARHRKHDLPYLPGALATIACRVSDIHDSGDHAIVIGQALSMSSAAHDVAPLLFFRGGYASLAGVNERSGDPSAGSRRPVRRRRVAVLERLR